MAFPRPSCSGLAPAGRELDEELRTILDALFCACLEELRDGARLRRDLFRLTEMEGQAPGVAARALGLGIKDAEEMLARTRRDIAVLLALGLCMPTSPGPADASPARDCRCGNAAMARRDKPGGEPAASGPGVH